MLSDLFLAYDFPEDDVIYLFYEIKSFNANKNQKIIKKNQKNDPIKNFYNEATEKSKTPSEHLDFFESKRQPFLNFSEKSQLESFDHNNNNNNSQCNKSLSLFSFSQRMPFKHTENFHSSFSNAKIFEKTTNDFNENCELSRFLKRNSESGENFPGVSQFIDKEILKNNNSLMKFDNDNKIKTSNSMEENAKIRKDQQHFQKITEIIDSFSKNDNSFVNFKENFIKKK